MNRAIWVSEFRKGRVPEWLCPACGNATLELELGSLREEESRVSNDAHKDDNWEPYWFQGVFIASFKCSRPSCHEHVSAVGDVKVLDEWAVHRNDPEFPPEFDTGHTDGTVWVSEFSVRYFRPCMQLIHLPEACPINIKSEITKSFELFWCDSDSSANHIRISLELLCDYLGVPRVRNGRDLKLDVRIRSLEGGKYKDLLLHLLAAKWLGNSGSHGAHLTRDDVFDALDQMEHIFAKIFDEKILRLSSVADDIVRAKGPRGNGGTA